jgi:sialidase-1
MQSSNILTNLSTGILYKNSKPHVKSVHAYFPSVAAMPNGELLATYALGEAFEAVNLHTCVARSHNGGQTWQHEGRIYPCRTDRLTSDVGKMSLAPDGELVANLARHDRTEHADEGLTNPDTMGFVPTEMLITRSPDCGHMWAQPVVIQPPLVGPSFELCSPVTFLRDGRWLLPTSTWLDWNGSLPNGNRMVAFVSSDRGASWPTYLDVMHSPDDNLIFWESKIVELSDGRLLAVAWCFDRKANADRPNQYALSHDGGVTWSQPQSTGLQGQTLTPCLLPDDYVLCAYRRTDQPGLWANLSHLEGDRWVNDGCQALWGHNTADGLTTRGGNMTHVFSTLKFGAPSMIRLADKLIYLVFWCYEENVSVIRWFRFNSSPIPPSESSP